MSSISTSVHQLKNSLVPINRLPPEVLVLILTFRKHERDLINATAVCRRWRRTFISTPGLWNKIICSEYEDPRIVALRVQMHIERSGSVPLEVRIHIHAFPFLSPHIERISSLEMFIYHGMSLHTIHLETDAPPRNDDLAPQGWGLPENTAYFFRGIPFLRLREDVERPRRHPGPWTMYTFPTHQIYAGNTPQ